MNLKNIKRRKNNFFTYDFLIKIKKSSINKINMTSSKNAIYVNYFNKEEIRNLDQNTLKPGEANNGVDFPYLYENPSPAHPLYLSKDGKRNMQMDYIIGKERDNHPDHSSRFSYDNGCLLEYCSGHWPGRYQTSGWCSEYNPQPEGMAPARFYGQSYQDPFNNYTQADKDYSDYMKTIGL